MSSYVTDYRELLKVADDEFEDKLLQTEASNFYQNLCRKSYYNYLGRYYYNKSLQNEYYDRIIVVPKNGYITQRLVYLNDDLVGGTKVGVQAINITEQDGDINLQNAGAVGFCPLGRFFDSLCYAFGIEVDRTKIDIYSFCDSVLQNFEFVYNRKNGLHIPINSANFNYVHVLYIVEDEKTYFDEDLVQAFANAMYNDGWFESSFELITDISDFPLNTPVNVGETTIPFSKDILAKAIADAYKYPIPQVDFTLGTYLDDIYNICINNFNIDDIETKHYYILVMPASDRNSASVQIGFLLSTTNEVKFTKKRTDMYNNTQIYGDVINPYRANENQYGFVIGNMRVDADIRSGDSHVTVVRSSSSPYSSIMFAGKYVEGTVGDYGMKYYTGSIGSSLVNQSKKGITIIDNTKLPTGLDSLSTDYPTWFSNVKNIVGTAVSDNGDALRNVFKIIEFVPLTLLGGAPSAEVTQDTIHTGVVLSPDYIGTLPVYTVKYLTPLPKTDIPISPDVPYIPIEDYTPSTPDEKYPWNSNPDTPIGNPVVNPTNPPAIGGVTPPVPDNPIMSSSNGLFTVYNPTQEQLNHFGGYLWGEDIVGVLQSIFQNPMQAIISLHVLYATPTTGAERPIRLGFMTSNVSAKEVTEQYINIDCGTVNVPEYYGNVLDYSPYTKAHIYLPFIGIREINVNEIMGSQVNVNYKVDVLTGSVYASISVFHNALSQVLYTFEGNCAVQLPLTGGDVSRLLSGMITGMAMGAKGGLAGAVIGTATGAFASGGLSVSKTNSIGANAGAMGIKKPYIIITNSQAYMANNYNTQYGYPSNLTTQLSACKGYTRVKEVHVENILVATQEEKDMIQTLLRQGVIIE